MKDNVIHLSLTARHNVSDILFPKNLQRSFWNALKHASFLGREFPDGSFVTQNILESKNGLSLSVSNSYNQEPSPSQKANQAEMNYCYQNDATSRSDYQDILSKRV